MGMSRESCIIVTTHAVDRYRQRYRDPQADLFEVAESLRREVNDAYEAGRKQNNKHKRFRLYKEKHKGQLVDGQRFLYREDLSMAWIVKQDGHKLLVVTTLSPTVSA
jgi:hypothetical protein